MVTFPGMLHLLRFTKATSDHYSHLPSRIHHARLRCRDAYQSISARTFCSAWQLEYNNMRRRRSTPTYAYMDTDCRLAHVQRLLWQSNLGPYAIRSPDAHYSLRARLCFAVCGSTREHPVDENAGP
jgi:hypothetical protein